MKNKIKILLPAVFTCCLLSIMGLYLMSKIIGATIYKTPTPTPEFGLGEYVEVPWLYTAAHQETVGCPITAPPEDTVDLVSITFGDKTGYFEGIEIWGNGEIFPTTPEFGGAWPNTNGSIVESLGNFHLDDGTKQVIEDPGQWWISITRCGEKLYYQKWQFNPNQGQF